MLITFGVSEQDTVPVPGGGGGGILSSKRLLGVCRWMGSHFHNWTDYNGVANFRDFWDKKILVSRDLKIGRFAVKKWFLLLF